MVADGYRKLETAQVVGSQVARIEIEIGGTEGEQGVFSRTGVLAQRYTGAPPPRLCLLTVVRVGVFVEVPLS